MKIAIGSDHAGYHYKEKIKQFLEGKGHDCHDFGTHSERPADYPLFVRPVAVAVRRGECDRGIVLGGSGNGEAIVANRITGIRCALCWNREAALLARKHNDANMLSLGARMLSMEETLEIVKVWLETPFEGGDHLRRIEQIDKKETLTVRAVKTGKGKVSLVEKKPVLREVKSGNSASKKYDLLISFRFIKYIEGKNSIGFQVDPGLKTPSVVHIPSAQRWNSEVPGWAQNRRDEILDRIRSKCAHLAPEWKEY